MGGLLKWIAAGVLLAIVTVILADGDEAEADPAASQAAPTGSGDIADPGADPGADPDTDADDEGTEAEPATTGASDAPRPIVHLTFDDGPNPVYTTVVLDLLDEYDAQATFFMLGSNAALFTGMVDQVRDRGHVVANHSWGHPDLTTLTDAEVRREIADTDEVLGGTTCIRPPYGALDARVREILTERGHVIWTWDVDSRDWDRGTPSEIAERVPSSIGSGTVVLLHDGGGDRARTLEASRMVLQDLSDRGYEFRPLPGC